MTMRSHLGAWLGSIVLLVACTSTGPPDQTQVSPGPTPHPSQTVAPEGGLPPEVAEVRSGILLAAQRGDYDMLRPLLDPEVFLSDFGFGADQPDPISRWEAQGPHPLQLMGVLLDMPHAVEDTNEGILYRWPTYNAETNSLRELRRVDRRAFRSVMSAREVRLLVPNEEYGYVGPELGILQDGTWWFFIVGGGP